MKPIFLSVCAVVKNELPYILEWIAFHKLAGVEHFYLYDNGSTDGTLELLQELKKKTGYVNVYNWAAVVPVQLRAYQHCLDAHRFESEWIAFLDCDEFLWSRVYKDLKDHIKNITFFAPQKVGAIAAHWFFFGSDGQTDSDGRLVIERFTKRAPDADKHVKSIVSTDAGISTGKDPHTFYLLPEFSAINDSGDVLPKDYALTSKSRNNNLRINHYHTKSHAEYMIRKKLGDPQTMVIDTGERLEERFRAHDRNEVSDTWLKDKYANFVKTMIVKELI